MCSGLSENIYYQFGYCILFGLGMGKFNCEYLLFRCAFSYVVFHVTASYAVFRLILLLELVELRRVENATGINLLFMGVACIIFPPLFGRFTKIEALTQNTILTYHYFIL